MQIKDLKEQSLKEIASVIRHWFNRDVDFKVAHKQIGDILDNAIQSAVESREREVKEHIRNKFLDLEIRTAGRVGSAQGIIIDLPWGEQDDMQVPVREWMEFLESIKRVDYRIEKLQHDKQSELSKKKNEK